ncbi:MAG: glycosyltransferase [Bacteroidota bacterium]
MRIVLTNYNYFPYSWGGSEIYVKGLASHLQTLGHEVIIVSAVDQIDKEVLFFDKGDFKVTHYKHEGIDVLGVNYPLNTLDIYRKQNEQHQNQWSLFWKKLVANFFQPDIIHLNGFTAIMGLSMLNAAKSVLTKVKITSSYHTPISCPKGNLLYFNEKECQIKPNPISCTACILSNQLGIPKGLSIPISTLLPKKAPEGLPTGLKIKQYVTEAIKSFQNLNTLSDQWIVHSNQIKSIVLENGVQEHKITLHRHGIDQEFLEPAVEERSNVPTVFAYVGRMKQIKGIQTLLNTWLQLKDDPSNRQLWLIGDSTSDEYDVKKSIEQAKKRQDIFFLGNQSRQKLAATFERVHVLICPSECLEIGPLVIHEAIAKGTNVIASDIGGCKELCNHYQEGCTVFSLKSIEKLKHLIQKFEFKKTKHVVKSTVQHAEEVLKLYKRITNTP